MAVLRQLGRRLFGRGFRFPVAALAIAVMLLADAPLAAAQSASKPATAKKPAARKTTTAKKPAGSKTSAAKKPAGTKAASAKKPAARKTTAAKKPAARKTTASKSRPSQGARRTTRRRSATATKPRVPLQPSAERLTEVQTALAGAGYLQAAPTGKWDDSSIAAMKRFQEEHSIPATGKINSLSLIALGLGPKRGPAPGNTSVLAPSPAETPPAEASQPER